jgi:hypothetical protein
MSSTGDFQDYRKSITWRSLGSLLVLPLTLALGLTGWFIGMLAAVVLALLRLWPRLLQPIGALDWGLIRRHVREGVLLSSISVLWLQLLNFARLYASMRYGAEDIATYGIISAGYQSVSTLLISIFLPVSVGILSRYGESEASAIAFAHRMLLRSMPWAIAVSALGILVAPPLLHRCFPTYQFDAATIAAMLLSIMFYPFFIVWGNLLVARQYFARYLLIILSGLLISTATARRVDASYPAQGAAWGQLMGIALYTLLLFAAAWAKARHAHPGLWRQQITCLGGVSMLCAVMVELVVHIG